MSNSLWKGVILYEAAEHAADHPFDTLFARVINSNANHLADEAGQVLISSPPIVDGSGESIVPSALNTPQRIVTLGPFNLRLQANGEPYDLRCRIHGRTKVAGTITFEVLVHKAGIEIDDPSLLLNRLTTSTLTATVGAWLTDAGGTNLLTLTAPEAEDARRTVTTVDTSGNPVTVETVEMMITVYGARSTAQGEPELLGLHVAEYVGT